MNIYDQQANNRRGTTIVIVLFMLLVGVLGVGFDLFFMGGDIAMPIGTIAALGLGGLGAWSSYLHGDRAVLASTNAVRVDQWKNADQAQILQNVAEEMSIASGLPLPKLFIVPDQDPNAFATGRDPAHASIAVTEGLLTTLNRDELQGVVAHEMSHIRNYDIRLMTIIAALTGAVVLLSDWASRALFWGGGGRRRGGRDSGGAGPLIVVGLVIWFLTVILSPIIAQLLAMMISRKREYLADASAGELTRNPLGLASALAKLEAAHAPTKSVKRGVAHLCIVDPLERALNAREGRAADLFATHPPMTKRIAALKEMAYLATSASPSR